MVRAAGGYTPTVAGPSKKQLVEALVDINGRLYSEEIGIDVAKNTPSPLFRWLCASTLYSARISSAIATEAARNLASEGWTTADKMAGSSWKQRVDALNDAGYTRYQERTATMLGDTAEHVLDRWNGDLRNLRDEADREPDRERELLQEVKGIGDTGVDIFFREAQLAWGELRPFADGRAIEAAKRLDLGSDAEQIARHADGELERLVAALARTEVDDDYDSVREAAKS